MVEFKLPGFTITELEAFYEAIGSLLDFNLAEVERLYAIGLEKGVGSELIAAAEGIREYRAAHLPPSYPERYEVFEWVVGDISEFKPEEVEELWTDFTHNVNPVSIWMVAAETRAIYRIKREQSGLWGAITGLLEGAVKGLKNFIADNLALVIIILIVALTAVFAPSLLLSIGKTVYTILEKIGIATAKTLTAINGWITTVKGWLHIEEIGAIMKTIGGLSRLLERISPAWAAQIEKWENELAKASKALFGDANTITAYLTAVQMAVWDISSLAGKSYDMFQIEWYDQATKVTTDIARKQEQYQNNPGALWYDIQEWFLKPLYGEATESRRASDELIGSVGVTAVSIQANLEAIDSRLSEYEVVLKPTDLAALKAELGRIRTSLRENAIEPLTDFKKELTDIYIGKLPDKSFSERWKLLVQPALDNANILGADEATLTDYQREQRLRKGENLLEFISRVGRAAFDSVIGGVRRLYTETIGKLDREEEIIPPVLEYTPIEWTLTPSLLPGAAPFKRSPAPPSVPVPSVTRREAGLSALDTKIQSIQEKL